MATAARAIPAAGAQHRPTKADVVGTLASDLTEAVALLSQRFVAANGVCRACTPRYRTCADYLDELRSLVDELPAVAAELVALSTPDPPTTWATGAAASELVMQLRLGELRASHLTLRLREAGPAHDEQVVVADTIVWLLAHLAEMLSGALTPRT